jgi:hypothetical protein
MEQFVERRSFLLRHLFLDRSNKIVVERAGDRIEPAPVIDRRSFYHDDRAS